jgi:hypothetical protein
MKRTRADKEDAEETDAVQPGHKRLLSEASSDDAGTFTAPECCASSKGLLSTLLNWTPAAPSGFLTGVPQDDSAVRSCAMNQKVEFPGI